MEKEDAANLLKPDMIGSKIWEDFSTDANGIIKVRAYYAVLQMEQNGSLNKNFVVKYVK
ncbi:hypothetical protein [Flavobacterium soyae]|uniref:Uncharacterized protein n=1 Tax=Flavobacterium soyae TaxID=2903098 RepID=A0ABZ2UE34_9FLAO|nr:hypothetical protein [Flavobacterium soyae]MCD9574300.1 hypothetical protein [Flavobacterium soyae]